MLMGHRMSFIVHLVMRSCCAYGGFLYLDYLSRPERSGPRGIGIHHAGAELEPAKGDSGVKR